MKAYSVYDARSLTRQALPRGSREAADAANKAEPPAMRGRRRKPLDNNIILRYTMGNPAQCANIAR